jgi:flagellar motor switch protein FliN/FliY
VSGGAERANLDVLLDVPLRVVAELGGCSLPVARILALGAGSIVELDRPAGGPVDLRVNEKLVARGEIVAVDERFGVRITELVAEG